MLRAAYASKNLQSKRGKELIRAGYGSLVSKQN